MVKSAFHKEEAHYSFEAVIENYLKILGDQEKLPHLDAFLKEFSYPREDYFPHETSLRDAVFYFLENKVRQEKNIFFKDMKELFFEKIMGYFDVLQPYKKAYHVFYRENSWDPIFWIKLSSHLMLLLEEGLQSFEWELEPLQRMIIPKAVLPVFLSVLPIWFEDSHMDLGKTMSTLDGRLNHLSILFS